MSIILNHLTNSLHTLNNVRNNLKQIEKISKLLEKKIKSGKKFLYMVMEDHLLMHHILLES